VSSVDDCVDDSTRGRLVEALTEAVRRMVAEGDCEGVKVALRALEDVTERLVGGVVGGEGGEAARGAGGEASGGVDARGGRGAGAGERGRESKGNVADLDAARRRRPGGGGERS
jgi:hypothetical protein